jgi:large subunit ribosomal protein L23
MEPEKILIRPIITEKTTLLQKEGKYVFEVSEKANKIEIKKAIEKIYKVKPVKVNIINVKEKPMRRRGIPGRKKGFKKAIVTLKKGEKIEF